MRTRLDGRDFNLRFLWNQRVDRWSLDINDAEGAPLAVGIRIVSNLSLLDYYQWNPALPPGQLIAHDLSRNNAPPPGFYEMAVGRRVELTYHAVTEF
jgi:hypothetical protein